MTLVTSLVVAALLVAACQSPPLTPAAPTSTVPPPTRSIATSTTLSTSSPGPPAQAPTARPTRPGTPAPSLLPHIDELTLPGSLEVELEEFTDRWNASEGGGGGLMIVQDDWEIEYDVYGRRIGGKYVFGDALDSAYDHVGLIVGINEDRTLRSAMVVYIPGQSVLEPDLEELGVIYAHSALIAAVLPDTSEQKRDALLSRVSPPAAGNYGGVEASTSEAGVRFRLTDQGSTGILFVTREDNLGAKAS